MNEMTQPPLVDHGDAPQIFVDGYERTIITNGVASLTFFDTGHNPETGEIERRVVLTMRVALPTLDQMRGAIGGLLDEVMQNMSRSDP